MPVWIYAMVIMFGVNHLIIKLGLDWAIDTKVKSRISGAMSDFAITAAIASLPVEAVMEYAVPILVMCAIGFVLTYIFVFKLGDIVYKGDYAFERSHHCLGHCHRRYDHRYDAPEDLRSRLRDPALALTSPWASRCCPCPA